MQKSDWEVNLYLRYRQLYSGINKNKTVQLTNWHYSEQKKKTVNNLIQYVCTILFFYRNALMLKINTLYLTVVIFVFFIYLLVCWRYHPEMSDICRLTSVFTYTH